MWSPTFLCVFVYFAFFLFFTPSVAFLLCVFSPCTSFKDRICSAPSAGTVGACRLRCAFVPLVAQRKIMVGMKLRSREEDRKRQGDKILPTSSKERQGLGVWGCVQGGCGLKLKVSQIHLKVNFCWTLLCFGLFFSSIMCPVANIYCLKPSLHFFQGEMATPLLFDCCITTS